MPTASPSLNRTAPSADALLKNLTDPLMRLALEELWAKAKRRHLKVADLFCGAGGTSTGLIKACEKLGFTVELTAVNHWDVAIATHTKNHPRMKHLCTNVDDVDPRSLYKEGELDILWSSPECIMHSRARGGKPINDQRRISAWSVCRWAEALQPPIILVENVMEFLDWGPVNRKGKPIKALRGTTYRAWKLALESLGYRVEEKILCAADYGDPTIRRRVFIYAVRGKRSVIWPEPTHAEPKVVTQLPDGDLFGHRRRPWVTAKEIIDWHIPGISIFDRGHKKDLVEKTIRRIGIGLEKFVFTPMLDRRQRDGFSMDDFILPQFSEGAPRSTDSAMTTLTASSRSVALIRPEIKEVEQEFLIPQQSGNPPRSTDLPMPTVVSTASGHVKIKGKLKQIEPKTACITHARGTSTATSVNQPHPSVTSREHLGIAAAALTPQSKHKNSYLTEYYKSGTAGSIDNPLETVTAQGVKQAITTSVLIPRVGVFGQNQPRGIDKPMPTAIAAHPMASVATAVLVETKHGNGAAKNGDGHRAKSMDSTMGAVTSKNGMAVAEAKLAPNESFILGIDHTGGTNSQTRDINAPVSTVITKQKHGLVKADIHPQKESSRGLIPRLVGYCEANKAKVKVQMGTDEISLADYLVLYYGTNQSNSIDAPMPSATTHDRVGVVSVKAMKKAAKQAANAARKRPLPLIEIDGQVWELDILFRMLNCRELARTQGFPEDYEFTGNKTETVAQIGNAVPCHLAEALGLSAVLSLFHSKANLTPFDLEAMVCPPDCPEPFPLPQTD